MVLHVVNASIDGMDTAVTADVRTVGYLAVRNTQGSVYSVNQADIEKTVEPDVLKTVEKTLWEMFIVEDLMGSVLTVVKLDGGEIHARTDVAHIVVGRDVHRRMGTAVVTVNLGGGDSIVQKNVNGAVLI